MCAGVHRRDAAWIQHGQAALWRAAGLYPSPCKSGLILKHNTKTAETDMILMLFLLMCMLMHMLFVMTLPGLTVGDLSHKLGAQTACLESAQSACLESAQSAFDTTGLPCKCPISLRPKKLALKVPNQQASGS